jgi:hypothetical protein
MDVVDHFRPNKPGSTPTIFPFGIFGTTTALTYDVPIAYDFGNASDTSTGIIAGNSIVIYGVSQGGLWAYGYYHIGPSGTITTNNVINDMTGR